MENQRGLIIADLARGEGPEVAEGDTVRVRFASWLEGSTQLESSSDEAEFVVGAMEVIDGWDLGVRGMRPGGKRRLIVAPELAYRSLGLEAAQIPPYATLVFDLELLAATR